MAKRSLISVFLLLGAVILFFIGVALLVLPLAGDSLPLAKGDRVGVVEVSGLIRDAKTTLNHLKKFRENDRIRAIVVRVNSPGGAVGPSQEILEEVIKIREKKKVVASLGTVAASGGYYIVSGADIIMANPGTLTGSIGVIMNFTNVEQLLSKIGLELFNLKAGKYKDVGSPLRPMTPVEKEYIQGLLDNVHEQFIRDVAHGRRMLVHKVREVGDGRIFTGEEGKNLGLVDALGNLPDAIDLAGRLGGIKGKVEAVYPPKEKLSLFGLLFGDDPEEILARWQAESNPVPAYLYAPGIR
ncbi:signal peptide peptidase SppA [Desulfobacca acetoxidans]